MGLYDERVYSMKDMAAALTYDLKDLSSDEWMSRVDDLCEEFGHLEPLGADYSALLIDAGRALFVSFESMADIIARNNKSAPLGWQFVGSEGWSSLTLLAHDEHNWFRHPAIFGYFDRLIDDGFFDDFDQVLFYGAGAAGYAAAAFSVAAPSAKVLLIQPQATLSTNHAIWDRRFPNSRRLDFHSRFGYGPSMVETASKVTVIHDHSIAEDAMHAQLYNGKNTTHLSCPYIGPNAERAFQSMGILEKQIIAAMAGTLTRHNFAHLWRKRQSYLPYLHTLFHRLEVTEEHPKLLARLCQKVSAENEGCSPFAQKLDELKAEIAEV